MFSSRENGLRKGGVKRKNVLFGGGRGWKGDADGEGKKPLLFEVSG